MNESTKYHFNCTCYINIYGVPITVIPPYLQGMFQDPQWMPEIAHSTEPYIHYVFSYVYSSAYAKHRVYSCIIIYYIFSI